MTTTKANYRVRITTDGRYHTYFTRTDGRTSYFSSSETPLALSNLLQEYTAETRFKLQDAKDGIIAQRVLFKVLQHRWRNNPSQCPAVELMP